MLQASANTLLRKVQQQKFESPAPQSQASSTTSLAARQSQRSTHFLTNNRDQIPTSFISQNAAAPTKPARQVADRFKFRYLKFKCVDIYKTIEFYQCMGMGMEWKVEMNLKDQAANNPNSTTTNQTNQQSKPQAPNAPNEVVTIFAMSFKATAAVKTEKMISAVIQTTPSLKEKIDGSAGGGNRSSGLGPTEIDHVQLQFENIKSANDPPDDPNKRKPSNASNLKSFRKTSVQLPLSNNNNLSVNLEARRPSRWDPEGDESVENDEVTATKEQNSSSYDDPIAALLDTINKGQEVMKAKKHNYEHLVIYVHMISRVVKRLKSKGVPVQTVPLSIPDMKMAVCKDPNGIEVRLMELTDVQLAETGNKKPWFGRPAYYTIPTNFAHDTIRKYERLFSTPHNTQSQPHRRTKAANTQANANSSNLGVSTQSQQLTGSSASMSNTRPENSNAVTTIDQMLAISSSISIATGIKAPQIASISSGVVADVGGDSGGGLSKAGGGKSHVLLKGFRLVDNEDIIAGLSRTMYYWMGNELRNSGCTICLTQKTDADLPAETPLYNRSQSALIGFGLEVSSIDGAVNFLKNQGVECDDRIKIKDIGVYTRFPDPLNNLSIEIFCPIQREEVIARNAAAGNLIHLPTKNIPAKRNPSIAPAAAAALQNKLNEQEQARIYKDEEEWRRLKEDAEFKIDTGYIKGMTRSLSEGAVVEFRLTLDQARMAIIKENKALKAGYARRNARSRARQVAKKPEKIVWNDWNSTGADAKQSMIEGEDVQEFVASNTDGIPDGIIKLERDKSRSTWW
ncbi:hypothetical protein HK098_005367 [Nowakowskiella sp. JEL0407]|nr:hypothetical protein HK098_005367 [Nowakowskiella sp. JEL0407]